MRSRTLAALDAVGVCGFSGLFAASLWRLASAAGTGRAAAFLLLAAPLGIAIADLASGVVHWFGDTFLDEATPLVGAAWIKPFREHHRDPLAITRHDFFEVSGSNGLLLSFPLAFFWNWRPAADTAAEAMGGSILLWFCFALAITNQLHCWSHRPRVPRPVRRLQAWGLVLSPERHAGHHRGRHGQAFCVTTGWWNPFLDRTGVFSALEHRLDACRIDPRDPESFRP